MFNCTREDITFWIAIVGFGLSIYNFIYEKYKSRKRVKILVNNVFCFGENNENRKEIINLNIINLSKEAITISQIKINSSSGSSDFGKYSTKLLDYNLRTNDVIKNHKEWYSDILPTKIEGLGFASGLYCSSENNKTIIEGQECEIILFTNKGLIKNEFTIDKFDNWKLISECKKHDC